MRWDWYHILDRILLLFAPLFTIVTPEAARNRLGGMKGERGNEMCCAGNENVKVLKQYLLNFSVSRNVPCLKVS